MPNIPLSYETRCRLEVLFPETERAAAAQLLIEQCGDNLPLLEHLDSEQLERFRFAALKLSGGSMRELEEAVALAKQDWRDLLAAAGFDDDLTAHLEWFP